MPSIRDQSKDKPSFSIEDIKRAMDDQECKKYNYKPGPHVTEAIGQKKRPEYARQATIRQETSIC